MRTTLHFFRGLIPDLDRPKLVTGSMPLFFAALLLGPVGCAVKDRDHRLVISVPDQEMVVLYQEQPVASYPVSTSKFGLGDVPDSYATPLGRFEIAEKIGDGMPKGAVFRSRKPTGEVLPVDAPGRDPIVTRILWLRGLEPQNRNAYDRFIYIHGTPEERNIGKPVSYGCVRMRSLDIVELYDRVGYGARVDIRNRPMRYLIPQPGLPVIQPQVAEAGGGGEVARGILGE